MHTEYLISQTILTNLRNLLDTTIADVSAVLAALKANRSDAAITDGVIDAATAELTATQTAFNTSLPTTIVLGHTRNS